MNTESTQEKHERLLAEERAVQEQEAGKKLRWGVIAPNGALGRSLRAQSAGYASARARRGEGE